MEIFLAVVTWSSICSGAVSSSCRAAAIFPPGFPRIRQDRQHGLRRHGILVTPDFRCTKVGPKNKEVMHEVKWVPYKKAWNKWVSLGVKYCNSTYRGEIIPRKHDYFRQFIGASFHSIYYWFWGPLCSSSVASSLPLFFEIGKRNLLRFFLMPGDSKCPVYP